LLSLNQHVLKICF